MKHSYLFLLLLLSLGLSMSAQTYKLNSSWSFQRLDTAVPASEIHNQGTDWQSQYNVEHIGSSGLRLAVPADTLKKEFVKIGRGTWETLNLPHTPFIEPLTVLHQWQGVCYYRKLIKLPRYKRGSRVWIEFAGAMQLADVWLDGRHLTQHSGGYTPFVIDLTDYCSPGREVEIMVRLDNRDNPLIPPGKPLSDLDFCYYGGIYRDVNLIIKPAIHITHPIMAAKKAGGGIFVTYPQADSAKAVVHVKTEAHNALSEAHEVVVRQTLYTWSTDKGRGRKVAQDERITHIGAGKSSTVELDITVGCPRLWHPDSPELYELRTELLAEGHIVDAESHRIGIRRIEMSHERGFLINGRPLKLRGTNRHQEYPYVGNAIPAQAQRRDIYQIKENGFNVVRLGHYPQDPSVLEACDELGLMAIEPIPGWQFFNKDTLFTKHTFQDIRDLIRRDRNHPCIIAWETTLNESLPPKEWKDKAVHVAHEEFPTDQCYTSGDAYGYDGFDICYNDWEEGFNRPNKTSKPGFIREYYDYEFGGHYSTTRVARGDGDRALQQNAWNAQWSYNRYSAYSPSTMGCAVWSMYDYNRGCCDNICLSGTADMFRLPKFSLPFFRTQVPAGNPLLPGLKMPYEVFVASHWTKDSSDTIQVYGNVDEVELRLNGKTVASKSPDNGPDTGYISRPDGGNCSHLPSPPFTFFGIPWREGKPEAIGYHQGKAVAQHTVCTPGKFERLDINYFKSGQPASSNDLLIIYVSLVDANGTVNSAENKRQVTLSVQGGEVVGPSTIAVEAGVASFLVRTADAKRLTLTAQSQSLKIERKLKLVPFPKKD